MALPNFARRLAATRALLEREHLDGLLVANDRNRRYLTGFTPMDGNIVETAGWVLVTPRHLALITSTFALQGLEGDIQASHAEVLLTDEVSPWQVLAEALARDGVQRLGFEHRYLSYERYTHLRRAVSKAQRGQKAKTRLVPVSDLVEHIRAPKDGAEVDAIRRAVGIAEGAFEQLLAELSPGMSERAIAARLEALMAEHGADGPSFPTIVAGGPTAIQLHAVPTERAVRRGEPLLIDFGVQAAGYCSDLTRTIVLGAPDPQLSEIYAVVRAAQSAAEKALQHGVRRGRDVDAAARQVIEAAGHGERYIHGTGHGVGLAVHELPSLTRPHPGRDPKGIELAKVETIEPGAVVTVEPGIYLPGWGGVRLEDMLLITQRGADLLCTRNPEQIRSVA